MKVIKILNNNLVFARDDSGQEVIVNGLGIGFHASRGDTVDESRIGQVFYPQDKQNIQQIQEFLLSIPAEYLNFVQDFVDSVKAAEGITFNSSIYLSLSDHLLEPSSATRRVSRWKMCCCWTSSGCIKKNTPGASRCWPR